MNFIKALCIQLRHILLLTYDNVTDEIDLSEFGIFWQKTFEFSSYPGNRDFDFDLYQCKYAAYYWLYGNIVFQISFYLDIVDNKTLKHWMIKHDGKTLND